MTRAKRSSPLARSRTTTAKLSERFEMYGNGCAGSTASGVSTGKMRSSKMRVSCARASASSSSHAVNATPASWSAGEISLVNAVACRVTSSSTRERIARSCSTWSRPSGDADRTPTATCSFSPATRTWKNSSTLPLKIARNLARSSSGTDGSSASASTRAWNSSIESSRLR